MRSIAIAVSLTAALAAGCSSEQSFVEPANDLIFTNQCEIQATGFPSVQIFEEQFRSIQERFRNGEEDQFDELQSSIATALTSNERTVVDDVEFVPQRIPAAFEPGLTTIDELRDAAGVREVQVLAQLATRTSETSTWIELTERYEDSLLGHCDSFFEEDIRVACEEGQDGTACFRLERIERRDLGLIEEACELAPYMLLCEPEDPPPYDLPRINEG